MPSAPQRALELYGIISLDVSGATSPVRGVTVASFRDLGALVADSAYAATSPNIGELSKVQSHARASCRRRSGRFSAHATH